MIFATFASTTNPKSPPKAVFYTLCNGKFPHNNKTITFNRQTAMNVAIIKYNAGNIFSVDCALRRIGVTAEITDNPEKIRKADKVIFPGVGEASSAMAHLRANRLDDVIRNLSQPLLGICIGQQLLCTHSEEGDTDCIGIFDVPVKRFQPSEGLKIPHMGWNQLQVTEENPLLPQALDRHFVYYVHSFYVPLNSWTIAKTEYIGEFSAAMRKDNFFATQFHPEKSGGIGEQILKNFIEL